MLKILEQINLIGIIPVIKIKNADSAIPVADALISGGIPAAEITFRTDAAAESIKRIASKKPSILLGAGTVLTTDQAKSAIDSGVSFIVSPGLNPDVVNYCLKKNICVVPGVSTPTEIERAVSMGLNVLKFFPAEANGGIKTLKALAAPYSGVKFMPTGGINSDNLINYLKAEFVTACGGSWIASSGLIENKDFQTIEKNARKAVELILGFKIDNIPLNLKEQKIPGFSHLFSSLNSTGNNEKTISVSRNFPDRAAYHLNRYGIGTEQSTEELMLNINDNNDYKIKLVKGMEF